MALATYKDLCIDAIDAGVLGTFWAGALDLELHRHDDGDAELTGPTPQHRVWLNTVPEPKTVKHRVHLDVNTSSVEDLVALGATVLDADSFRWTLMADPEGGEFCAFVREGDVTSRLFEIVVDTADSPGHPLRIATWWADMLGAAVTDTGRGFAYVHDIPQAPFESIDFVPVPEQKTVKNRIHLDVTTPDLDRLVAAGADVLRPQDDQIGWTVLADPDDSVSTGLPSPVVLQDPDGNEFCAFLER
ncbi:MAG TPA: VOC family protein [Nocardioidaceae bacterium]|nr:VOC family protein [Nocardioidaceae bacterium]